MANSLAAISTRRTPQNERADSRQAKNNAGGYTFQVSDEVKIHRFLTLGTEGGTYYQKAPALTQDNAKTVLAAARDRGEWLVERIVEVSLAGRAPKQDQGIFALAAVAGIGDDAARAAALAALPQVCRTGSALFKFATFIENFRGWGRGLRGAVGRWYTDRDIDSLAYQLVKYRQREGWSHRDLLRLSHPRKEGYDPLFKWATGKAVETETLPPVVRAHIEAMNTDSEATWTRLIATTSMSWEMLPDAALSNANVWRMLIQVGMPQHALLRQLPRLTRLGVLQGEILAMVVAQLTDSERLRKARVHPVSILMASKTYASGVSYRGTSTWQPVRQIVDALDAAFYAAFQTVESAHKRTLLALDVSGSMGSMISETNLSCREASAALALVTMAIEPEVQVVGFTSGSRGGQTWSTFRNDVQLTELALSPRQRLDDAVRTISNLPFGGTDCALPMMWAQKNKLEFDTIAIYTDSETWAGRMHPHQALRAYRESSGINTRVAVVGMTATDFSIADPADPGMLDIAGFDSAVPNLITDFSRGTI